MALLFDASTEKVDCGNGTSLRDLTTWTTLMWIYIDSLVSWDVIWDKEKSSGGYRMAYLANPSSRIIVEVKRATTVCSYTSTTGTITTGSWLFLAHSFDFSGSASELIQIYKGTLSAVATEVSYAGAQDGTGAFVADDTGNFTIGNATTFNAGIDAKIAFFGHWNRVLTLEEIIDQQFNPHVTNGCVLFQKLGFNGTGTQPDWSGNGNNGTVTGATVSDHVPLRPPFLFTNYPRYVITAAGLSIPVAMHNRRQQQIS